MDLFRFFNILTNYLRDCYVPVLVTAIVISSSYFQITDPFPSPPPLLFASSIAKLSLRAYIIVHGFGSQQTARGRPIHALSTLMTSRAWELLFPQIRVARLAGAFLRFQTGQPTNPVINTHKRGVRLSDSNWADLQGWR
jgi:hypothetical protein